MAVMARASWTDERLEEFGTRVDERFDRAEAQSAERFERVDERFERVDERFDRAEEKAEERFITIERRLVEVDRRFDRLEAKFDAQGARLDSFNRTLLTVVIGLTTAMITGFVAAFTLIATQL